MSSLRCSSLPMAFKCPGSVRTDTGVLIDPYHDAATMGTDVHRLLASHPDGDALPMLVNELSEEARILYYTGAKMWREHISAWMPNAETEVDLTDGELSGHADIVSLNGSDLVIVDWKTGRKDSEYKHQGFGYAFLASAKYKFPAIIRITVHFAWIRTQEIESYTVTLDRANQWVESLTKEVVDWDGVYHPGEHCEHCKRFAGCPAHVEMNRTSLATLTGEPLDLATMQGPQMASIYRRLGPLAAQIDILQKAIRAEVKARGTVDDGAGRVLHYVEQNAPREVDALKAWPVLSERLSDEELAACVSVSIGAVETAVAEKAAKENPKRGAKKEAKDALQAALEKVGAIRTGKVLRFRDDRKEGKD